MIRSTRRITIPGTPHYLDLHPGEEIMLGLLDGGHTLEDLNRAANDMLAMRARMPMRTGSELVAQLDAIGALLAH
jgi:hypothetical protein